MASVVLAGCHGKEGDGLPPATGSAAPPAPVIPRLSDVSPKEAAEGVATPEAAWTGSLFARHEAQLGPKSSGVISQITVEEGDRVKKGQLLFRLETNQASLGVEQARAAIASAQVGLDSAKLELNRSTDLIAKNAIAPAQFDQSKSQYDRAAMMLEQSKVNLRVAQRTVIDSAITSPINGVVTAKSKSVGETATMMPPTIVLVVQDVDHLELRAKIPEKALAQIREGSKLRMTIPTLKLTRDVPVKRINPAIDQRTRTIEVIGDVDNQDGKLKVGMFCEVSSPEVPPKEAAAAAAGAAESKLAGAAEPGSKAP
jgi:RND family efflux transporter MFP subunit